MLRNISFFLITAQVICMSLPGMSAQAATTDAVAPPVKYEISEDNLRNQRYCEILYGERKFLTVTIKVFSTEGLNTCPEDQWKAITEKTITQVHATHLVRLNGPRFWTIDGLKAAGATVNDERESFGGIEMNLRATIDLSILEQLRGPGFYRTTAVSRTTEWIYKAGSEIYELIAPSGEVYVMQSYTQIVNPQLTVKDLANLGQQLQLPKDWSYKSRVLKDDLNLTATGTAYLLQDNLFNSYQRQ